MSGKVRITLKRETIHFLHGSLTGQMERTREIILRLAKDGGSEGDIRFHAKRLAGLEEASVELDEQMKRFL